MLISDRRSVPPYKMNTISVVIIAVVAILILLICFIIVDKESRKEIVSGLIISLIIIASLAFIYMMKCRMDKTALELFKAQRCNSI
jgi:heme/copper-type cytochrome/quinol oxidase subunit 4